MTLSNLITAASFAPNLLSSPSAWVGHLPFAAWVINEVKPKIFVELGAHSGNSYFSFCQSVAESNLATKCYAVDTWQGDEHAGSYSDEVFDKVNAHNQERYVEFSQLMKMNFDDAIAYFEDESIGLLHIDGLHTYEAVKHDFETWLPKLAPNAVVLFHDTNVRERGFGVWRLWEELQAIYPSNLEFLHSHGLGVLQLNSTPENMALKFLQPSFPEKQVLIRYFSEFGSRQLERLELNEVKKSAANLNQAVAERDGQISNLSQTVAERDGQISNLSQTVAERDEQIVNLNGDIEKYLKSNSWKATRPLRCFASLVKDMLSSLLLINDNIYKAVYILRNEGIRSLINKLSSRINRFDLIYMHPRQCVTIFRRFIHYYSTYGLRSTLGKVYELTLKKKIESRKEAEVERADLEIDYRIVQSCIEFKADDNILLYVAYCPDSELSELQKDQIDLYLSCKYKIIVIINTDEFDCEKHPCYLGVDLIMLRENVGFDFGAWGCLLRSIGNIQVVKSISFTNDSICCISQERLLELKATIDQGPADVYFMTESSQRSMHAQSFFFVFKKNSILKGGLQVILDSPNYRNKEELIVEQELLLMSKLKKLNFIVEVIFETVNAKLANLNPTLDSWQELVAVGFPFVKIDYVFQYAAPRLLKLVGDDLFKKIAAHLDSRKKIKRRSDMQMKSADRLRKSLNIDRLFNELGVQQAFNPPDDHIKTVQVPLNDIGGINIQYPKIAAIIHCYYIDVAESILSLLSLSDVPMTILLTTDTQEKNDQLLMLLSKLDLDGEVRLAPNRGRDIAPFLIEGASFIGNADLILHLHTKKSKHDDRYRDWGDYTFNTLIGSRDIIKSVCGIFENPKIGIVYPEHFCEVKNLRNWGFDYEKSASLLKGIGISITAGTPLDFPTGSMFWARAEAVHSLFTCQLDYDDFDIEAGQTDGTLAHAIERSMLFISEYSGFINIKIFNTR